MQIDPWASWRLALTSHRKLELDKENGGHSSEGPSPRIEYPNARVALESLQNTYGHLQYISIVENVILSRIAGSVSCLHIIDSFGFDPGLTWRKCTVLSTDLSISCFKLDIDIDIKPVLTSELRAGSGFEKLVESRIHQLRPLNSVDGPPKEPVSRAFPSWTSQLHSISL